jgi:hypothetical protein
MRESEGGVEIRIKAVFMLTRNTEFR